MYVQQKSNVQQYCDGYKQNYKLSSVPVLLHYIHIYIYYFPSSAFFFYPPVSRHLPLVPRVSAYGKFDCIYDIYRALVGQSPNIKELQKGLVYKCSWFDPCNHCTLVYETVHKLYIFIWCYVVFSRKPDNKHTFVCLRRYTRQVVSHFRGRLIHLQFLRLVKHMDMKKDQMGLSDHRIYQTETAPWDLRITVSIM